MQQNQSGTTDLRLAEMMGALSIATDLGMGQPIEHALRSCVLAVRLGEAYGLAEDDLRDVYYYALLRFIGCNAESYSLAALFGDELALRTDFAAIDAARLSEVAEILIRQIRKANAGAAPLHVARLIAEGLLNGSKVSRENFAGHCEVAQRLAARMGFNDGIQTALGQLYERWDGKGTPNGLKGEAVSQAVLVVTLAQDAITFLRIGGVEAATAMAKDRRGTVYHPALVDCFCQNAATLLAGLDTDPSWEAVIASEPGARVYLSEAQFDTVCEAIADFADIKSPYTLGHSPGVAELASDSARRFGLPDSDAILMWRAGLLHDVGRVGVSAGIWTKSGPLTDREWERVRMHPYYTERILSRPKALARLGAVAALHHERLDGSGYHRGAVASMLSPAARLLAAANTYRALTEVRPHRAALSPDAAALELRRQARAGKLDGDAVNAVLAAAGHKVRAVRRDLVAGLSEREIEVLRLMARGNSMKQIAARLSISAKTVDNHIQNIYIKIGVSTRAGATLFAIEQDLLANAG